MIYFILLSIFYSNRFIVMALPETIKGFTFRFLKIVINSEGIEITNENENKLILLKAYLIFVIIHVLDHFLKRCLNIDEQNDLGHTPKINCFDDEGEGGKQLIKLLFGDELIKKGLNIEQAQYILDIKNWLKLPILEFRKGFLNIKTDSSKDSSIIYLRSEKESICDHSKLFA